MSTEITVVNDIVEINVQEDVIVIEAPSGAYPLPTGVYSVYGRTGNVVAQDGDYNLTQLGDVTITSPATGQVLRYNGTTWVNSTESYVGTVTSVAMTTPTGLTVTGSPITTAGTLAVGLESGYSIPTTANQSLWTTAYNDKINSAAVTGLATKTLTLTQQDGGTITASWDDAEATRLVTEVYNATGATLTKGTVVYISGGQGNLPKVVKAQADSELNSYQTYGLVQSDITNMNNGFVVVAGALTNLNTNGFVDGTTLYLSPTTAGAYTSIKPTSPDHIIYIGVVVRAHPTQGVIEVKIQNTQEISESSDVLITSPTNNQILQYDSATSLWKNVAGTTTNIAEGTNLYYTNARSRAAFSESVTGLDYNSTTGVLSTTTGYGIPTTASQATWNTAYNDSIVSAGVTGTTTKTLTLNQQDGGTITASWTDYDTAPVTSVFGRTGAVTAQSGDYTTTQVTEGTNLYYTQGRFDSAFAAKTTTNLTEGTNLYFTNTRARAAISETVTGLDYDNTTGVLSTSAGYGIPTTASQTNWDTAYTNRITSASAPLSIASNAISISQANTTTNGFLSSTDWNTFNNKQAAGNYITALTGEATASGPGSASVTLTNSAVIGKVLTGLNVTGGSVSATDSILDAFGKVQNQINGLIGGSIYQGTWNASTNTPTLTSSVGTKGYYYIVNVAGSTNLNGITDWKVGDWAIYDGTAWQKVDNTDAVSSVNGFTGAVSLTTDNISEGSTNLYFTNTRAQNAITLTTTGTSGAATYSGGTLNIPQYQSVLTNPVTGTGTTNTLPKFTGTSAIGNSNITDTGSLITLGSNSFVNGNFGLGTSTLSNVSLRVSRNITGSANPFALLLDGTIMTDATGVVQVVGTYTSTANSASVSAIYHFNAVQGILGTGATITNQYGFVASGLTQATNNYGFYGNISAATNRWNIYMNGTAANYLAGQLLIGTTTTSAFALDVNGTARISGQLTANSFVPTSSTIPTNGMYLSGTNTLGFATNGTLDMTLDANGALGIGTTSLTGWSLRVGRNITGATSSYGISSEGSVQSDVTTQARGFNTFLGTQAATFTLPTLYHYYASQATFGANSVVTNQHGFSVDSGLTGATNNFAFFSNLAAGTGRWNLYMNGTANNYLAGSLGIGSTSVGNGINLNMAKTMTGAATQWNIYNQSQIQSDVITLAAYYRTNANTAASSFTLSQLFHYQAVQGTIGATSAVTSQFGFSVDASLTGATNNYGFFGNIASGTNRWNIYMQGTAANYMAGQLSIGTTSLTEFVNISNSTNGVTRVTTTNSNAGTATQAQYQLSNGTHTAGFGLTGSAFTSSGVFLQGGAYLSSGNSAGGLLLNTGAAQPIYFGINNTERARLDVNGNFGVGTNASNNASAKVQVDSTTQGFLPPRMTAAQRAAIASPATGLMVYQTDGTEGVYVYSGGTWKSLTMV